MFCCNQLISANQFAPPRGLNSISEERKIELACSQWQSHISDKAERDVHSVRVPIVVRLQSITIMSTWHLCSPQIVTCRRTSREQQATKERERQHNHVHVAPVQSADSRTSRSTWRRRPRRSRAKLQELQHQLHTSTGKIDRIRYLAEHVMGLHAYQSRAWPTVDHVVALSLGRSNEILQQRDYHVSATTDKMRQQRCSYIRRSCLHVIAAATAAVTLTAFLRM